MLQAIELLLRCELFEYHDARMVNIMMADAQEVSSRPQEYSARADKQNTHPHELYILYHLVQEYGDRHPSLFRSHRKWKKLLPTLGEVVGVECEEVSHTLVWAVHYADKIDLCPRPTAYRSAITLTSHESNVRSLQSTEAG
jgi:hypothetical protein